MKKNNPFRDEKCYSSLRKIYLTMRIAIVLLLVGVLQLHANESYSQTTKLSISFNETELIDVLDKIEEESELFFLYNEKFLDTHRKVSINADNQQISAILDALFADSNIKYTIVDRKIILAPDNNTSAKQQKEKIYGE